MDNNALNLIFLIVQIDVIEIAHIR